MKAIVILCAGFTMLASACNSSFQPMPTVASEVYVLVPPRQAASFIPVLASIVEKRGMSPNVGQATDDKGNVLRVLDAESGGLRLRSENMLLSGQEDPARCGVYTEPHPDPGQYFISISSGSEPAAREAARELLHELSGNLKTAGYDVRTEPVICSASVEP